MSRRSESSKTLVQARQGVLRESNVKRMFEKFEVEKIKKIKKERVKSKGMRKKKEKKEKKG